MTLAKVDGRPEGRDRLRALFTTSAVTRVCAAFAQLLRPNPGKQLSSIGTLRRKQLIRDKTDSMRRELNMPPVKWGPLR
jgi:hypothetical protein